MCSSDLVRYREKSIHDILELSIDEALEFFRDERDICNKIMPLQQVGLGYIKLGQSSDTLSGGEAQRVKLASFLGKGKSQGHILFLFDEPTTGLDPNQIVEIRKLIRDIGKEKTVILSTHILPEVEATCDRILIINKGKIVADGTSETLRKQAAGQETVNVRIEDGNAADILSALRALPEVESAELTDATMNRFEVQTKTGQSSPRAIFRMCVDRGWTLTEMTAPETRLEDVFRNVTLN